jgi:hypothetical protein
MDAESLSRVLHADFGMQQREKTWPWPVFNTSAQLPLLLHLQRYQAAAGISYTSFRKCTRAGFPRSMCTAPIFVTIEIIITISYDLDTSSSSSSLHIYITLPPGDYAPTLTFLKHRRTFCSCLIIDVCSFCRCARDDILIITPSPAMEMQFAVDPSLWHRIDKTDLSALLRRPDM